MDPLGALPSSAFAKSVGSLLQLLANGSAGLVAVENGLDEVINPVSVNAAALPATQKGLGHVADKQVLMTIPAITTTAR
ncbi:hypothetical protein LX36DRAFT_655609 [Colletotrichum falcatum]|nr:hypothetical protein LX36DRAFT_655609 [Colletotrichum falcatum]